MHDDASRSEIRRYTSVATSLFNKTVMYSQRGKWKNCILFAHLFISYYFANESDVLTGFCIRGLFAVF